MNDTTTVFRYEPLSGTYYGWVHSYGQDHFWWKRDTLCDEYTGRPDTMGKPTGDRCQSCQDSVDEIATLDDAAKHWIA